MQKMVVTWANYLEHITRHLPPDEVHKLISEERKMHLASIERAKEHLAGCDLFYEQSVLKDPLLTPRDAPEPEPRIRHRTALSERLI